MKLCIDCAHFLKEYPQPRCIRRKEHRVSLIDGSEIPDRHEWCSFERRGNLLETKLGLLCGKVGQYWEPKK